eukprot:GEZU01027180.1.p1 GENE.GEZU01027180.1~~GEZU01027180.1.p1  ORF type:complete len:154 (-),score=6.27 GEZU01027180.1:46-507(-)
MIGRVALNEYFAFGSPPTALVSFGRLENLYLRPNNELFLCTITPPVVHGGTTAGLTPGVEFLPQDSMLLWEENGNDYLVEECHSRRASPFADQSRSQSSISTRNSLQPQIHIGFSLSQATTIRYTKRPIRQITNQPTNLPTYQPIKPPNHQTC